MKEFGRENLNNLVPELLGKISECANNLRDRVKINSIYSEFDSYTHENFQKFINMSQQRYKSIKSGNHLEKKLQSQKMEYNDISSQILSNRFYNNNEIEYESRKLLKKMNQKENNKEISQLRLFIIQKTRDFTKKEVMKRERLASAALARRKQSELDRLAHRITRRDLVYRPESMKKQTFSKENIPIILNKNTDKKNEIDEYLEKKKFFDDLMENDCKNLNENIADYKAFVKDVEKAQVNKDENFVLPGTKKDNYGHTFTFLTDGIKMLSYKEEQVVDNKPTHYEEPKIDIIKLMRYTKRGNKKWFQEELKKKSVKRLTAIKSRAKSSKLNINQNIYNNNYNNEIMAENNKEKEKENEVNNMMDYSNFNMNKTNNFSNFRNTIKTVRNEAEKAYYIDENFYKKRDTMDLLFNNRELPRIDEYEHMIEENMKKKPKIQKNNVDAEKNEEEEEEENEEKKKKKRKKEIH